jgi:putative SOS response-associated peptidase YedK
MCGRVVSARPRAVLAELLEAEIVGEELAPRWNVAPAAPLYAVAGTRTGRRLGRMKWGLVPSWAASPSEGPRPINARAETLLAKPMFAEALIRRRCIIPVDGFYEWERLPDGSRLPWYFSATGGPPLALAGLWDRWADPKGDAPAVVTCTIVTTAANDVVSPLHDRMPAVLDASQWQTWLAAGSTDVTDVLAELRPAPLSALHRQPASSRANSTSNDDPQLLSA